MRLLALRLNKRNLIFSGSLYQHWPWPRPLLGNQPWEAPQGDALCSSPIPQTPADYTYTHIHTYWLQTITHTDTSPKPQIPTPPSLWTASLTSGSGTSAKLGCRTWMAACQSWITSPVAKSCVYVVIMCFLLLRCFFPVLTLYSQKEHSLGVVFFFFSSLTLCMLYISSIPCLPVLSTPLSYCMYVWTGWWLISLVLVTSDNKGLLLLLLLHGRVSEWLVSSVNITILPNCVKTYYVCSVCIISVSFYEVLHMRSKLNLTFSIILNEKHLENAHVVGEHYKNENSVFKCIRINGPRHFKYVSGSKTVDNP